MSRPKGHPANKKGIPLSKEVCAKMAAAWKKRRETGWEPANKGKKFQYSPERIAKLRENIKKAQAVVKIRHPGDTWIENATGYRWVCAPGHPSGNNKGWIHEHRIIAEKALGRRLKRGEVVHHINGDKSDNRNCNLLICTNSYHMKLHSYMAYLFQRLQFSEGELL